MEERKGEEQVLIRERKRFRDRDKGLKVDQTDERVIFVTFVKISSLSSLIGCEVGSQGVPKAECEDAEGTVGEFKFGCKKRKTEILG